MEALKPNAIEEILDRAGPAAAPALRRDVEVYERLLSERFTRDPDLPKSPQQADAIDRAEAEIAHLYKKLFVDKATRP